jgi:MerR family transcriptional regulator, thiopeptide resistance regulator
MLTVKKLAQAAGVSPRTLHYYDQIGLLKPSAVGKNGYRHYDEAALLRLQQILFYREMEVDLERIRRILDRPDFDLVSALQEHRAALQQKIQRMQALIRTIDVTILHQMGEIKMTEKSIFTGFSEEQQKAYEDKAAALWGEEPVRKSAKLWNIYSKEKQERIKKEGGEIYSDIAGRMHEGPESAAVQACLKRWHQHLRYFYEPTPEILRGLGAAYNDHPDFHATFAAIHPDLPAFLKQAITLYVDGLEAK